ncbi:hypothetical protein IJU22_00960 [Candidatus Saccharibacteria bacterium]|nr:hypothetical protein [Candidatus Saccharibacteria bacterium]
MKKQILRILPIAIVVVTGLLGLLAYQNRVYLTDLFLSFQYSASPELSSLENDLELTDSAGLILRASHPSLESREEFNILCDSHDEQISVLGCYTDRKIYIYNIEESELSGIKESTLAHELLHAVWARTPSSERDHISRLLAEVYNQQEYHDQLAEDLETYDDAERVDELHSRIGTEIANLPAELESHYAKYFKNQDKVVDFYENYITPFRELSEEIDNLSTELEKLNQEIEEKTSAYYKSAEKLSAEIDEFNNCARTSGCFATEYAFNARRNQLLANESEIESAYEKLNKMINDYNKLVEEYNANVIRGETLESVINSNAKYEEKIK